jgi:hypothetical protein
MFQQSKAKLFLNMIALTISCLVVAHFFASFATSPFQKLVLATVGIFIDVVAQFILALSKLRWRQKQYLAAAFLFSQYLVYILAFAIPSSIGYCATGLTVQEQAESKDKYAQTLAKTRLGQIDAEIKVLNLQLEAEAQSGYGERSQQLLGRIDELSAEQQSWQQSLLKSMAETFKSSQKSSGKVAQTLSRVYQLPENVLLQVLFSIATWMVYLTLILTSWDLAKSEKSTADLEPLERPGEVSNQVLDVRTNVSKKLPESFPESMNVSRPESELSGQLDEHFKTLEVRKVRKADRKTSPMIANEAETWEKSSEELLSFVAAAIRDSGSLNGVQKVAEKTGLPLEKCLKYRAGLDELQIDGKPIISKARGGSASNFPKEVILNYLRGGGLELFE